jgi:hypothetical protein
MASPDSFVRVGTGFYRANNILGAYVHEVDGAHHALVDVGTANPLLIHEGTEQEARDAVTSFITALVQDLNPRRVTKVLPTT